MIDTPSPKTVLVAKPAGKKIRPCNRLRVRNPDGSLSVEFILTGS